MRKVQIQNMEHEASERDVVVVAHDKDGQTVVHIVKPGRVSDVEIEPKTFIVVGDHRPEWLDGKHDADRVSIPEPTPAPEPAPSLAEEAPADPLDHDGDGKKGGSKAKKAKG